MKKYLKIGIVFDLCLLSSVISVKAQDVNYSQFFNVPAYYNPALTGLNTGLRASFSFRDQWPKLPVDFTSYNFSAEFGDRNLRGFGGGVSINVNSNNEGVSFIRNQAVGLNLAVRIPITSFIATQFGFKASIVRKHLNWDDFVFSDQLSERYGNIYLTQFTAPDVNTKTFPDFGAGGLVQFTSPKGFVSGVMGLAVDHIFQPDESFLSTSKAPLPRKYIAHFGFALLVSRQSCVKKFPAEVGDPFKLNAVIMLQSQGNYNLIQVGDNIDVFNMTFGSWYKTYFDSKMGSSLVLLAGPNFFLGKEICVRILYSYDLPLSGSLQGYGGAHEISLILGFGKLRLFGQGITGDSADGDRH